MEHPAIVQVLQGLQDSQNDLLHEVGLRRWQIRLLHELGKTRTGSGLDVFVVESLGGHRRKIGVAGESTGVTGDFRSSVALRLLLRRFLMGDILSELFSLILDSVLT